VPVGLLNMEAAETTFLTVAGVFRFVVDVLLSRIRETRLAGSTCIFPVFARRNTGFREIRVIENLISGEKSCKVKLVGRPCELPIPVRKVHWSSLLPQLCKSTGVEMMRIE